MIDYKLVLILVLSIVLLFIYNRIEDLRDDVDELKKKNKHQNENDDNKKVKTSEELLSLFQEKNRIVTDNSGVKQNKPINNTCDIQDKTNKCEFPVLSKNQSLNKSYIVEKDNTSSYNATESSEDIDINYEDISSSQNDEFVIFSNDKENSDIINVQDVLDNLQNQNNILLNEDNVVITTDLLKKTYNGNIDIINDSSNSDEKNNINIGDLETYSEISKDDSENKLMHEFDNIEIVHQNGVIQLQKRDYDDDDDDDDDNEYNENDNDNDDSESFDGDINTSEFQKINLNSITKYKLNDLQNLAKKHDITITKDRNGKEINKTKKELYSELTTHKQN